MKVTRGQITWKLAPDVVQFVAPIRQRMGEAAYKEDKHGFQDFMCKYFSTGSRDGDAGGGCTHDQGDAISPTGCPTEPGWKCLKVRWVYPGSGKGTDLIWPA